MKIRFVQACCLGACEYAEGEIHDLPQHEADLALNLRRAVPHAAPAPEPEPEPEPDPA
jgi:hypothetical protein